MKVAVTPALERWILGWGADVSHLYCAMNEKQSQYLRAAIHRVLDDTAQPLITRAALCASGAAFDPEVLAQLRQWEARGYLQMLGDPDCATAAEPIVRMLSYIEQRSSIPGFLNWQ